MARNTHVAADHNAPPVTRILGKFRGHASVARLERRGGPRSPSHLHELAGLRRGFGRRHEVLRGRAGRWRNFQPAPQATVLGRRDKVDMASTALVNGVTSHTFDFDDRT